MRKPSPWISNCIHIRLGGISPSVSTSHSYIKQRCLWLFMHALISDDLSGVILDMGSVNERGRYIVMPSHIGWIHTQIGPYTKLLSSCGDPWVAWTLLQYIPRNMHTVFALLCFVVVIHWLIFPYPSGLLHWHCGNLTIAPVPAKQPWWIWINTSCEFIMNNYITTTKQSTTKLCTYFLGYTVSGQYQITRAVAIYDIFLKNFLNLQYIPRNMHTVLLCFALLWLCNRS